MLALEVLLQGVELEAVVEDDVALVGVDPLGDGLVGRLAGGLVDCGAASYRSP